MIPHSFLLTSPLSPERLSWIEESLKFFFMQLYPETLTHQKASGTPLFTFFLSGDALYSLVDPELLQVWNIILSFPPVQIICDREELELRGINTGPLKMKFPDQITDINPVDSEGRPSFWKEVVSQTRESKAPLPGTAGWFQTGSPYMHRSAWHGIRFLSAAIGERLSAELYACLDGVHCGHHGQNPADSENIGKGILQLNEAAVAAGVTFSAIGAAQSATARGYSTWDDGQGQVISTCTLRPFRIRDLSWITARFGAPHPILAPDAGLLTLPKMQPPHPFDPAGRAGTAPPVTILVARHPYNTGHTRGAISFAVACAHAGILTRVIFIEDGIFALTGMHRLPAASPITTIPELINLVAGNENLHFFAFSPSFQKRGILKDRTLNAVLDIGYPGLGKIFFYPQGTVQAGCQRVLIF